MIFNKEFILLLVAFFIFEIDRGSGDQSLIPTYRTLFEKSIGKMEGMLSFGKTNRVAKKQSTSFGAVLDRVASHFHAIYPGTKWCGAGNIAESEDSLGTFANTDKCCRAHDECFSNIEAGGSLTPLLNNGIFTRSNCICDHEFYKCLKDARNPIAVSIGMTYFNILRPQCFALDYPIVSCAKKDSMRIVGKKCSEYNLNTNGNKTLQWFDNPDFPL